MQIQGLGPNLALWTHATRSLEEGDILLSCSKDHTRRKDPAFLAQQLTFQTTLVGSLRGHVSFCDLTRFVCMKTMQTCAHSKIWLPHILTIATYFKVIVRWNHWCCVTGPHTGITNRMKSTENSGIYQVVPWIHLDPYDSMLFPTGSASWFTRTWQTQ